MTHLSMINIPASNKIKESSFEISPKKRNTGSGGLGSLQDRRKMHRLTSSTRLGTTWSRSRSQSPSSGQTTAEHETQRLFVPYTNVTVYMMSFFPMTIQEWNKLPSTISDIQKIGAFKTALHASIAVQPPSTA